MHSLIPEQLVLLRTGVGKIFLYKLNIYHLIGVRPPSPGAIGKCVEAFQLSQSPFLNRPQQLELLLCEEVNLTEHPIACAPEGPILVDFAYCGDLLPHFHQAHFGCKHFESLLGVLEIIFDH